MAVAVMFGLDWASSVFFNFSARLASKAGSDEKHAVLAVDLRSESLKIMQKERTKAEVSLSGLLDGGSGAGDVPAFTLDPDDALRISFRQRRLPPLRMYSAVDRSILQEVMNTFVTDGNLVALRDAYPRRACHHGVLEKSGKWTWSARYCVAVKWKFYVFRDWYSQDVLQAISLIGLPVTSEGTRELVLHTVHGELRFRALNTELRDEWYCSLRLAGSLELNTDPSDGTWQLHLDAEGNIMQYAPGGTAKAADEDISQPETEQPEHQTSHALRAGRQVRSAFDMDGLETAPTPTACAAVESLHAGRTTRRNFHCQLMNSSDSPGASGPARVDLIRTASSRERRGAEIAAAEQQAEEQRAARLERELARVQRQIAIEDGAQGGAGPGAATDTGLGEEDQALMAQRLRAAEKRTELVEAELIAREEEAAADLAAGQSDSATVVVGTDASVAVPPDDDLQVKAAAEIAAENIFMELRHFSGTLSYKEFISWWSQARNLSTQRFREISDQELQQTMAIWGPSSRISDGDLQTTMVIWHESDEDGYGVNAAGLGNVVGKMLKAGIIRMTPDGHVLPAEIDVAHMRETIETTSLAAGGGMLGLLAHWRKQEDLDQEK